MSEEALKAYARALEDQAAVFQARNIRTKVHQARQAPQSAGLRWPFELLQNALDPGPRYGRESVTVRVHEDDQRVVFEHDGAPFSLTELAALLSGGSSKEFDSEETTGRFGTGFLVTHVLAERASLEGLLALPNGHERFRVDLDRSGDEEAIVANIVSCKEAIRGAMPIADISEVPSARFDYATDNTPVLHLGLGAFRAALPFVFGTRPSLAEVQFLRSDGPAEIWMAESAEPVASRDGVFEVRRIHVQIEERTESLQVIRAMAHGPSGGAALFVLRHGEHGWEVQLPAETDPKLYCQYPFRASTFLPVNVVLDGHFDSEQERSRPLMNDADKRTIAEALDAAVMAATYACSEAFHGAHLLAAAAPATSAFDPNDPEERAFWTEQLGSFAERVAARPVVQTTSGLLPALAGEGWVADFIAPRLLDTADAPETTVERMWDLLDEAGGLHPPVHELAVSWSGIAAGWKNLGVDVNLTTVERLGRHVRANAGRVSELRVNAEPTRWLARYLDLVGECWEQRQGEEHGVLDGLLPDQHGALWPSGRLQRDAGITEDLKNIGAQVGLDLRAELLASELLDCIEALSLEHAKSTIARSTDGEATGDAAADRLVAHFASALPEDMQCPDGSEALQFGTAQFLEYLWLAGRVDAAAKAKKVPLVAASKKVVHWSPERKMMAPVLAWHEDARPFSAAYPEDRILDSEIYLSSEVLVAALDAWGIAYPDPITTLAPRELEGDRLASVVLDGFDSTGVAVRGVEFGQIALLATEVINHVQTVAQAQALLGLVLCHAARHDPTWRERRNIEGWRDRTAVEVPVRGALWLGDLRRRAWVPGQGEDDKTVRAVATTAGLTALLDPGWLQDNEDAIQLLIECFDFDELDLRLLGISDGNKAAVRSGLARLLEAGGQDPRFYENLADAIEARERSRRDVDRCRRMGLAVQDAVREALESQGLQVTLVDHGFDYEVEFVPDLEDIASRFEIGPYMVEVKATTTGAARLTPLQARTAAEQPSRYVLCVVDLRSVSGELLDGDWTGEDVAPLTSMLCDIGGRVHETCGLVHRARANPVGIRNEAALRYEVPAQVWGAGISIGDWVARISGDPGLGEPPGAGGEPSQPGTCGIKSTGEDGSVIGSM